MLADRQKNTLITIGLLHPPTGGGAKISERMTSGPSVGSVLANVCLCENHELSRMSIILLICNLAHSLRNFLLMLDRKRTKGSRSVHPFLLSSAVCPTGRPRYVRHVTKDRINALRALE